MDSRKCQTATATPAKPGVLPLVIGEQEAKDIHRCFEFFAGSRAGNLLISAHEGDWKCRDSVGRLRHDDRGGDWPSHYPCVRRGGGFAAEAETITPPGSDGRRRRKEDILTNLQLFFAIVGVMSAEIAVVLAFTFHGFDGLKRQIDVMRR